MFLLLSFPVLRGLPNTTYCVGIISHFTSLSFPILSRATLYIPSISDSGTRALTCLIANTDKQPRPASFLPPILSVGSDCGLCVAQRYASRQRKTTASTSPAVHPPASDVTDPFAPGYCDGCYRLSGLPNSLTFY
ncbi:uncharacterized protein LY79DRAFT_571017 [Colletotrichum navitas]|uniref:Uncharacterized protein n=1 Tax=Colletotrichum navitas TaxID=681940 RepID=A0AAD8UY80_9PEZI|nr:uncharacterized protein LY79DRAFT_571017 [Colletotrichum navitas]KAK1569881.1 hypothetical protein LY79DRAFT_571017 [Colletotrichum navitas]